MINLLLIQTVFLAIIALASVSGNKISKHAVHPVDDTPQPNQHGNAANNGQNENRQSATAANQPTLQRVPTLERVRRIDRRCEPAAETVTNRRIQRIDQDD